MTANPWVDAAVAILLGVHLVVLLYAATVRARGSWSAADSVNLASDEGESRDEDGVCRCPECGAENEAEYRFCRSCVAELPGGTVRPTRANRRGQPY